MGGDAPLCDSFLTGNPHELLEDPPEVEAIDGKGNGQLDGARAPDQRGGEEPPVLKSLPALYPQEP